MCLHLNTIRVNILIRSIRTSGICFLLRFSTTIILPGYPVGRMVSVIKSCSCIQMAHCIYNFNRTAFERKNPCK